jgi:hypothetical protein
MVKFICRCKTCIRSVQLSIHPYFFAEHDSYALQGRHSFSSSHSLSLFDLCIVLFFSFNFFLPSAPCSIAPLPQWIRYGPECGGSKIALCFSDY